MAGQMSEHGDDREPAYDDRRAAIIALIGAVLMSAAIIGVFMFITWFTYATD